MSDQLEPDVGERPTTPTSVLSSAESPEASTRVDSPANLSRRRKKIALVLFLFFEGYLLFHYGYRQQRLLHADLPSFYFSAQMAFVEGRSPYDFATMAQQGTIIKQPIFPYLYPPSSLVPLFPFSLVSYDTAKWLMVIGNHLLLVLLAYLLAFRIGRFSDSTLGFFVCALLLISFPSTQTLVHSQVNFMVIVLICLAWLGLRSRDGWWPGISIALAVLLKQSPVILLALLVLERRWKALSASLLVLFGSATVSRFLAPPGTWKEWFEVIRPSLAYGKVPEFLFSPACPYNQSFNGLVSRFFLAPNCTPTDLSVPLAGQASTYLLAVGMIGISMVATYRLRRQTEASRINFGFALLMPTMFLVSPLAWEHHLIFVFPSLFWLCSLVVDQKQIPSLLWIPLGISLLVISLPLPIDHPFLRQGGWIQLISLRTYGVLVLWIILVYVAMRASLRAHKDPS